MSLGRQQPVPITAAGSQDDDRLRDLQRTASTSQRQRDYYAALLERQEALHTTQAEKSRQSYAADVAELKEDLQVARQQRDSGRATGARASRRYGARTV